MCESSMSASLRTSKSAGFSRSHWGMKMHPKVITPKRRVPRANGPWRGPGQSPGGVVTFRAAELLQLTRILPRGPKRMMSSGRRTLRTQGFIPPVMSDGISRFHYLYHHNNPNRDRYNRMHIVLYNMPRHICTYYGCTGIHFSVYKH